MSEEIHVESARPLPRFKDNRGRKRVYPFDQLVTVGMKFFVPGKRAKTLWSSISRACDRKELCHRKFKPVDAVKDGVTGAYVWRIK